MRLANNVTAGTARFGVANSNFPRNGWMIQKVAHHESREGQRKFNNLLIDAGVQVEKNNEWVSPPLGEKHSFDGDHIKDLGFGGEDASDNYWPLDSTINRRAFAGYNARYLIHYHDGQTHKTRPIGGLIGKWFRVEGFLDPNDEPFPENHARNGGTPL